MDKMVVDITIGRYFASMNGGVTNSSTGDTNLFNGTCQIKSNIDVTCQGSLSGDLYTIWIFLKGNSTYSTIWKNNTSEMVLDYTYHTLNLVKVE